VRRPGWLRLALGLVLGLVLALAPVASAAAPPTAELPMPDLPLSVSPRMPALAPPVLALPAPPPAIAPKLELGTAPVPRFDSAMAKPWPLARDPGMTSCTFAFGRASALADCGVYRLLQDDLRGAREAFEDSVQREPWGPSAAVALVWLGEIARHEGRHEQAERHYRSALPLRPPADLTAHAALGLAWLSLRRGDLGETRRMVAQTLAAPPPPVVALFARFFEGVERLQAGRPAEALPLWDAVAAGGPPPQLAEELLFWRGVALARLGQPDAALAALDRFLATAPARHPLRVDAIVQGGWAALARGAADDAVRRLLLAQSSGARLDLVPPLRAGLVQAYLTLGDTARAADTARLMYADSARDPLLPPVLLLIAEDKVRRGQVAEAVDEYRRLLALAIPVDLMEYATYRLAEALEQLNVLPEAERQYRALRDGGRIEGLAQRAAYRLGLLALRGRRPGDARVEGEALLRASVLPELREAVLLLTAEAAARGGDANRAVGLFRALRGDYPASSRAGEVRLALGWALFRDGDPEAALREWQEAAFANDLGVAVQAYLAIADVALRQGREEQSLAALRELAKLAPTHPLADALALNRGILLVRAQEYAAAVQELELIVPRITDPPQQATVRRALGIARYHLNQFDAAEREFAWAAHWAPAEPSHHLGAGLAALRQNRLAEASRALGIARLAASPEIAQRAAYGLVLAAERARDVEGFRKLAGEFAGRYPEHPATEPLLYRLVRLAVEQREPEQADQWLRRLLQEKPTSALVPDALVLVAQATLRDRPAVARQAYGELLARVREAGVRAEAWLGLAEAATLLQDPAETQRALEGFLAEAPAGDPRAAAVLARLVQVNEAQNQREGTLAAIERFLAGFPQHPLAPAMQLKRGYFLLGEQQWGAARPALEAARNAGEPPVAASAHFYLGELHRTRGEHEDALAEYLAAAYVYTDTMPWSSRGLQGAVLSYLARQKPREASVLLRKLLAQTGVEPELAQWARRVLTQIGPLTGEDPAQVLRKGVAR
jgi:tetratricopeptide (TPR) repeat protein